MKKCICGKIIERGEFCSDSCKEIYDQNIGLPKKPGFNIFKIYVQKGSNFNEYIGQPNFNKTFKPCKCGGTMKTVPIDTYYMENRDGYYLINITSNGRMLLSRIPTRAVWSCNNCNIIENAI